MAAESQPCKHYQRGYCKYQQQCRSLHVMETCENKECSDSSCTLRHPRICNFFLFRGFCKFGDKCAYLHENKFTVLDSKIVKLEMEIKKVTEAIENLNKKQDLVSLHSSISKAFSTDPSKPPTTQAANSFSSLEASSGYFDTTAQSESVYEICSDTYSPLHQPSFNSTYIQQNIPTPGDDGLSKSSENEFEESDSCNACGMYFATAKEYSEFMKSVKNICRSCELFFSAMCRYNAT